QPDRHAVDGVEEVHPVHTEHDELGVADPDDVDDAEDQVEAEREQRQHAAEQETVDHRLEQIDVEDAHGRRSPQTPRYASRMLSLTMSSAARPAVWMWPVLSR